MRTEGNISGAMRPRRWLAVPGPATRSVAVCWALGVAALLGLASCATSTDFYVIERSKINEVVTDVLTSQQETARNPSKLEALREYETYILKHFAYKDDLKAEALHRLGDLYMKMEDTIFQRRLLIYTADQNWAAQTGKRPKTETTRPKIDHSRSIAIYGQLLKLYPDRKENDSVLYQLAKGYYESHTVDEAIHHMVQLLKNYPKSRYRYEAAFRLGEFFFESGLFKQAAAAYTSSLKTKRDDSPFVEIARYKLGWTHFQLEEFAEAGQLFLEILDHRAVEDRSGKKRLNLNNYNERDAALLKEVISATLLSIDYQGGADMLAIHFQETGHRDYEELLYRTLGEFYLKQERVQDAGTTYETFVKENPLHDAAPLFQSAMIRVYTEARWVEAALEARIAFDEEFGSDSLWSKRHDVVARNRIKPQLKESVIQVAQYYHAQAQTVEEADSTEAAKAAVNWYQRFLDQFPDEIEAGKVTFLLGELLYDMGRYTESAIAYEKSAYFYPTHQSSAEAGYGAIHAAGKAIKHTGNDVPRVVAIAMYENASHFAEIFPKNKHVPEVLLKGAEMAYRIQRYDESRVLATQAMGRAASNEGRIRYLAQKIISGSYFEEQNFSRAATEYRRTVKLAQQLKPEDAAELKRVLASAIYKQMEDLKNQGKTRQAAEGFLKLYEELPTTDVAGIALFDAGATLLSMGNTEEGINTLLRLLRETPDSPHAHQAMLQIGSILQQQGRYQEALKQYNEIAKTAKDPMVIRDAYWAMATLAEDQQEWAKAYNGFAALLNRPDFSDPDRRLDAKFRAGLAKVRLGDQKSATTLFQQVIAQAKKESTPNNELRAGQAWLQMAALRLQKFDAVRLVEPLAANLRKKQKSLKLTIEAYTKAASYKIGEVTTEATYQTGQLFESYRTALLQSERPSALTSDQLEEYNFLLEEQAAPYEERAIAAYEANVRRAREQGLYTPSVQQSFERLATLLPSRYQRQEQGEVVTEPIPRLAPTALQ